MAALAFEVCPANRANANLFVSQRVLAMAATPRRSYHRTDAEKNKQETDASNRTEDSEERPENKWGQNPETLDETPEDDRVRGSRSNRSLAGILV